MAARSAGVAQTAFARSRAVFERELILARTGEGRKRAKERGVRFGRPRKLTPHQREEALRRLAAGETQADVARTYNVSERKPAVTASMTLSRSRVERARLSNRVTPRTSSGSSRPITLASSARLVLAPRPDDPLLSLKVL